MVVCRLRRNREFRTYTSQKAPLEPDLAADMHMILQNGDANSGSPSDWESMVDFYLAGESWDNHVTETPENLQVCPFCVCSTSCLMNMDVLFRHLYTFVST